MKKIIICLLLFITTLAFVSCNTNPNNTNGNGEAVTDSSAIWTQGCAPNIVFGETSDWNPSDFIMSLGKIIGAIPKYSLGGGEHEIVIGNVDHPLARTAYEKMERLFSNEENNAVFLIYSDGSSVAIAYD